MFQDNANNVANLTRNLNNDDPLPLEDVNPPQAQQAVGNGWNLYRRDPKAVDVTRAIMLPPIPKDTKFVIYSGFLYILQHRGLFSSLPIKDLHKHLHNVIFVCKSMMGNKNLSMDVPGLRVFPLSLTGEVTVWLSELP